MEQTLRDNRGVIRVSEHDLSRRAVTVAVAAGVAVRHGAGVIATREAEPELIAATALRGVVSHLSAAKQHGWKVAREPSSVHLTVPRGRRLRRGLRPLRPTIARRRVTVHYAPLTPAERRAGVTSAVRTVLDCATSLPFAEALAVADSALRAADVSHRSLVEAAERLRGPGSARARRVVEHATHLAANPYESALRAICLTVPGLKVTPQHHIVTDHLTARVDLADPDRRLVLEADSYTYHATPTAFAADIRRYDELVLGEWTVLRFSWQDVFTDPDWVRRVLVQAVSQRGSRGSGRTKRARRRPRPT